MSVETRADLRAAPAGWRELWTREDWWAIWLGLGIVLASFILFAIGREPALARGAAGKMVVDLPARRRFRRERASLYRAVRVLARRVRASR